VLAPNKTFPEDAGGRVPMGAPVVEILSADKVFPNGTRALAPIDLTIAAGEFLTLSGPRAAARARCSSSSPI
jgi:NitT/TauT family transport system ATP-binding protein